MLLIAYEANASDNKEKRRDLQEKLISRLKYIDFLINLCYDKEIINGKRYLKFGENIDYILKYTNGWRKNTVQNIIKQTIVKEKYKIILGIVVW